MNTALRAAKAAGLMVYVRATSCPHGHAPIRRVSNDDCLECMRLRRKRHYTENCEDQRANSRVRMARHYATNPEPFKARARAYYWSNTEHCKSRERTFRREHPENIRAFDATQKARKRAAKYDLTEHISKQDIFEIFEDQEGLCSCGAVFEEFGVGYTVDHKTPLSRGGSNRRENIQLLCAPCNNAKHTKTMEEWERAV